MVVVDREGYQLYRHLLHSIYRLDICDYGPLDFDIMDVAFGVYSDLLKTMVDLGMISADDRWNLELALL
jgi:hypothetical protein